MKPKRKEFFSEMSKRMGYMDKKTVREFYYELLRAIITGIKEDGRIDVPDLGIFRIHEHRARRHKNVAGYIEYLEATNTLKFDPCLKLKNYIKNLRKKV